MSRKVLLLILGASFLGLAVIGISLGLILTRPSGTEVSSLSPYIPSEVPMGLFIRLPLGEEAKAWSPLSDVLSEIPGFQMGIAMLWDMPLFPGTDISLKRDVEPWLGSSLAVGFTQVPVGMYGGIEPPSFLLAAEVRDVRAFHAFLDRLRSEKARIPLQESTYGRHTLFVLSQQDVCFALRDERVLLLSNDLDTLKGALEREEKDSLASNVGYRTLLGRLPPDGVFQGYVSSEYLGTLQRQAATVPGGMIPTTGVQAIAFTLRVEPEGLRAEFAALIDREALAKEGIEDLYRAGGSPNPERALSFLPKESLFAYSARVPGLDTSWEEILSILRQTDRSAYMELQRALEELSGKGLDVEKDLLPWLGGEVGLYISLDQEEGIPLGPDAPFMRMRLGLVIGVSDLEKAREGMQKLEILLGREAGFSFSDREISGLTFRISPVPEETDLTLGYALADNFLLLVLDEASLRSLAQARTNPGERLSASEEFQAVLRFLPGSRTSLLFINLEDLWKALASILPVEARPSAETWLSIAEHFRGLGIASAAGWPEDEVATATLFLHIVR